MDIAARKGGIVMYSDPHIPEVKTHSQASLQSEQLTAETLQNSGYVVLNTNHDFFDIEFIKEQAKLIADMRDMIKDAYKNVYKL